jgi:hypothetical protein
MILSKIRILFAKPSKTPFNIPKKAGYSKKRILRGLYLFMGVKKSGFGNRDLFLIINIKA